ncbi:hypothetical protein E3T61_16515 [Cryobacterium lactosi]|uniref:Uncharacterized protein n=1 Tax=Cryobacterium lactosi TaxID=1259202 RepID=A0A4R9BJJ1_9MICO|nr:hypothetical protein [Cryobacterium lactosi]TFD85738.1 hypothetical protein E3T61_16515 [Cryobacterium lactosi]
MTATGTHRIQASGRPLTRSGSEKTLITLESVTSATALAGGLLLMLAPDGSLLMADPAALDGTGFGDWLLPGAALALFVGLGFAVTAVWQWRRGPYARFLSLAAGVGLVLFEVVQFSLIGFHPLQAVFGVVGVVTAVLAWRLPGAKHGATGGALVRRAEPAQAQAVAHHEDR